MSQTLSSEHIIRKGPYPELSISAILVGYLVGSLITISIGYACLILGFSTEGSELAAILGFGILRGVLRRHSIVENNINQTLASAVNSASAGMMFSVPALFILGETAFNPFLLVIGCIAGGVLGVAFVIPLRKQMIDYNRLAFPGGVAVATILKVPGAGIRKAWLLLGSAFIAAVVHLWSQGNHVEYFALGDKVGLPSYLNATWYISLLTIGVGFIAGKGGLAFIVGGYVAYWIMAPSLASMGLLPTPEQLAEVGKSMPEYLRSSLFKPVGIGMLIGGALTGILLALPLVLSAIKSMHKASKTKSDVAQEEVSIKFLYLAIVGAFILFLVVSVLSRPEMTILRGLGVALMGTLWIWVSGVVLSECIGRTNWSPLSGMTLIGVTILIAIISGIGNSASIVAAVVAGACMCVAMAQATDLMLDLKTGYLVGAIPRKQQYAQFLGTWLGPILVMGLILVLHKAYGLGSEKLPAPQGQALAGMITGILGGNVPLAKYLAGAGMGSLLSASGIGGLGIMVGLSFYLPFSIVLTYTIGTLSRMFIDWKVGHRFSDNVGIPIAAGLIVGEALVGVGFALYYVFQGAVH